MKRKVKKIIRANEKREDCWEWRAGLRVLCQRFMMSTNSFLKGPERAMNGKKIWRLVATSAGYTTNF